MTRKSGRYAAFRPAFLKQRSVMGLFGPSGPAAADDALRGKAVLASLGIGSSYVPAASVADPERIGEQSRPFVVGAAGGRAAEAGFPPAPGPAPPSASWLPAAGWPVGARPPSPTGPPGPFAPPVGPAGPGEAPGGPARTRETSPPQSGQPAAAGPHPVNPRPGHQQRLQLPRPEAAQRALGRPGRLP
ncbi:MAG: hypothetical protein LBQ12_14720, partial [Deltaproteobacteria bacterium]|nr:hypothetical protein [Deltaproteobacteria bacterium]